MSLVSVSQVPSVPTSETYVFLLIVHSRVQAAPLPPLDFIHLTCIRCEPIPCSVLSQIAGSVPTSTRKTIKVCLSTELSTGTLARSRGHTCNPSIRSSRTAPDTGRAGLKKKKKSQAVMEHSGGRGRGRWISVSLRPTGLQSKF